MRKASDTALRYLALLQLIPLYPKRLSTEQIRQALCNKKPDYEVDIRSIQRDLDKLSATFPLNCEQVGRIRHWFWSDKHQFAQIPMMSQSTAFAFKLAAEYLKPLIPPATLHLLAPYFKHATEILQQTKSGEWSKKTRIIGRGPELIVPTIKPDVQEVVYEALLEDRQFEVDYRRKCSGQEQEKEQEKEQADAQRQRLNPLGIVLKHGIIYLVATSWDYQDPRHYALHRMSNAKLLDQRVKPIAGFNLIRHVEQEKEFSYPLSNKKIKLRALFFDRAAIHLTESKLSEDQKAIDKKSGQMLIEATVADTAELRWWLLGFGSSVKVLGPSALRKEFSELAEKMSNLYKQ